MEVQRSLAVQRTEVHLLTEIQKGLGQGHCTEVHPSWVLVGSEGHSGAVQVLEWTSQRGQVRRCTEGCQIQAEVLSKAGRLRGSRRPPAAPGRERALGILMEAPRSSAQSWA